MLKKILIAIFLVFILAGVGAGVFLHRASTVRSEFSGERVFMVEEGEDAVSVGERLSAEGLVPNKWYFLWSAWRMGLQGRLHAGEYVIPGKLSAGEVVSVFLSTAGKPEEVTLTFPEGWTAVKIADRLSVNHFDGERFLQLVQNPDSEIRNTYPLLANLPESASLEGFLFPDTYTFRLTATPEDILQLFLKNFSVKFDASLRDKARVEGKTVFDIVTMASILEREVGTTAQKAADIERERSIVSDIFWRRLADGHRLESDATLAYALGTNKIQHSVADTENSSLYNTYAHVGLPPGPISNPGLISLRSALSPISNEYYYFLNNPNTGETVFSKTFDEHVANKNKNGL